MKIVRPFGLAFFIAELIGIRTPEFFCPGKSSGVRVATRNKNVFTYFYERAEIGSAATAIPLPHLLKALFAKLLPGYIHHPKRTKFINTHTKRIAPRFLFQWAFYLAAIGKFIEVAGEFFFVITTQG